MFPTLLFCLGLDPHDQYLLEAVPHLAAHWGGRRIVLFHVHVHDSLPEEIGGMPRPEDDRARRLLDQAVRNTADRLPGVEVVGMYAVGQPYEKVLAVIEAESVDLVVLGRIAAPVERLGQGLSGREILRYAACPVLVLPDATPLGTDHALVGVDFSRTATESLLVALGLYPRVTAVYVYTVDPGLSYGGITTEEFTRGVEENTRRHWEQDVLPLLPTDRPPPELRILPAERASDGLLAAAEDEGADLLVVGGHGRTRLAALLLGSTAERVADRADRPVLVVREKGERLDLLSSLVRR